MTNPPRAAAPWGLPEGRPLRPLTALNSAARALCTRSLPASQPLASASGPPAALLPALLFARLSLRSGSRPALCRRSLRPPAFGWPGPHGAALHSPAQPAPASAEGPWAMRSSRRGGLRRTGGVGGGEAQREALGSGSAGPPSPQAAAATRSRCGRSLGLFAAAARGGGRLSAPHRPSQPSGGPARPGERREERPELGLRGPAVPVTLRNDLPGHRRGRAAAGPKCRRGGGRTSERPCCRRGSASL